MFPEEQDFSLKFAGVLSLAGTGGKGSLNWGIHADYIVVF